MPNDSPSRMPDPGSPAQANDDLFNNIAFLNAPFQALRNGWVPWVLFALALVAYYLTVQPGVFPGAPAGLAAPVLGARSDLSPMHFVWKRLVRFVAGDGLGMVHRANLLSAFFGAVSVGLCYAVMRHLLTLVIEPTQIGHLPAARQAEGTVLARRAASLGALASSLVLAFCLPFWISSTRVSMHTFYVAWLLLSALLMLLYMKRRATWLAFLWAFVHVAGMTQTSAFLDFFPLLAFLFLYVLWGDNEVRIGRTCLAAGFGGLLGVGLLFLSVWAFYTSPAWAEASTYTSYLNCANRCVKALIGGVRGGLGKAPWLILLGLTIAPWAASLIAARRAINGEVNASFYFLHAVIAVISVLVALDFRASPWRFMGTNNTTVVPYVLTSMTFGYITAYLYLLPVNLWANSESSSMQRLAAFLRPAMAVVFLAIAAIAAVHNFREADPRPSRAVRLFADEFLDSLEGRPWVVTSGMFDDVILLRAKERGIDVHCLNSNPVQMRRIRRYLPDIRLQNASTLGVQTLVQEWLASFPDAPQQLALAIVPDLWTLGKYQARPNKLAFLGVHAEELAKIDPDEVLEEHLRLWDAMEKAFDEIPDAPADASPRSAAYDAPTAMVRGFRDIVFRPRLSLAGNDLGYSLSMLSRDTTLPAERRKRLADVAYEIYTRVHRFDPGNVSATLNWASKVFEREPEEKTAEAREELQKLNDAITTGGNLSMRNLVWALSRFYGYVEDPAFFANLGWSWANTGQPNLAMQALANAQDTMPDYTRLRIKAALAQLNFATAHTETSESIYREMLLEEPGNHQALMGLVHLCTLRGDTKEARDFLARAEESGVPVSQRMIALSSIYVVEGDEDKAVETIRTVLKDDPQNTTAWTMLCSLLYQQRNNRELSDAIRILEGRAGRDSYEVLIAKALLAELGGEVSDTGVSVKDDTIQLRNNLAKARDYYVLASRLKGQTSNVMLLRRILSLDRRIADKPRAKEHAQRLLRIDLQDPFANYIMGSLSIDDGNYKAAEAYLTRSAELEPAIDNLNDLADVLYNLGKYDEAESRVQQAFLLPEADQSYELWDTRGVLRLQRGDLDGAEEAFQRSLSLFSEDMRVHLHLANVYHLAGDQRKALAAELIRFIAAEADSLPRNDRRLFEELHLKILGVRYSEDNYKKK